MWTFWPSDSLSSSEHSGDDSVDAAAIDFLHRFEGQGQGDFLAQGRHPVTLLLDVWVPATLGAALGMRDVVAESWLGAADLTVS